MDATELNALVNLLQRSHGPLSRSDAAKQLCLEPLALDSMLATLRGLGAVLRENSEGVLLVLPDPLNAEAIARGLEDLEPPPLVEVLNVCESTNARLLARKTRAAQLCLSEVQTSGRGRRGNAWVQSFGTGLALSLAVPLAPGRLDGLATAIAVATAQALEKCGVRGIGLKWPNDLYAQGAKLGGVMVEASGGRMPRAVIGVGLNVHAAPVLGDRRTVALADLGTPPTRNALAIEETRAIYAALACFGREGLTSFVRAFERLDVLAGQPVRLTYGSRTVSGVVRGIGAAGEIVLETANGARKYTAGEVSLGHG